MLNLEQVRQVMSTHGISLVKHTMKNGTVLYAPHNFEEKEHYKCGPNHNKVLTWLIPDKVYFNRESACKVHDHMYTYPDNTGERYRYAADSLFKINMDLGAYTQAKTDIGVLVAAPMNNMFYYFVRWFGKNSYYMDKV